MRNIKGQGLIEILITVVILASGMLALTQFQVDFNYTNSLAVQRAEAAMISVKKLDELTSVSTLTAYSAIANGSQTTTGVNASYATSWTVTTFTNPNYSTIELTTTWTDIKGNSNQYQLSRDISFTDPLSSIMVM